MLIPCVVVARGVPIATEPAEYYSLQVLDTERMIFLAYGMGARIPASDRIVRYLPLIDDSFLEWFPRGAHAQDQ